jgi:hypothetical protein
VLSQVPKSFEAVKMLETGGWFPGRCIDTLEFRKIAESIHFRVDDFVESIISEFDEILVKFETDLEEN